MFTNQNTSIKPVFLMCGVCVAVPKQFNLDRHFKQLDCDFDTKYPVGCFLRTEFILKKKKSSAGQQCLLQKISDEKDTMVKAS